MDDDDDIQEYVSNNFAQTFKQVVRNETLEEVAKEIEKMTAFGNDTIASFAVYIRSMKR
jgi:proline dehydrogenase